MVLNLSFWELVLATLLMTHVTIASVTIFLHRAQASRTRFAPMISHFFRFWLWLTTGMITKQWVAIIANIMPNARHRMILIAHNFGYPQGYSGRCGTVSEAVNSETLNRYGHGTPHDWLKIISILDMTD